MSHSAITICDGLGLKRVSDRIEGLYAYIIVKWSIELEYIYVSDRKWAIDAFLNHRVDLPGNWMLITTSEDLNVVLKNFNPDYIFFPHWSNIVPSNITGKFDCVCFHMTDLPFGRGGSPLQNLIVRGVKATKLTALKMVEQIDAGPIYK